MTIYEFPFSHRPDFGFITVNLEQGQADQCRALGHGLDGFRDQDEERDSKVVFLEPGPCDGRRVNDHEYLYRRTGW